MAANEVCPDYTGKIYKFDSAGRMESGWKKLEDGKYYYFGNDLKYNQWIKKFDKKTVTGYNFLCIIF